MLVSILRRSAGAIDWYLGPTWADRWRSVRSIVLIWLALAAVGFFIVGCSNADNADISPAESVLLGCATYASTLQSLAPINAAGKLSPGVVKIVNGVVASVGPVCKGDAPDVNATVANIAVDQGVTVLKTVLSEAIR